MSASLAHGNAPSLPPSRSPLRKPVSSYRPPPQQPHDRLQPLTKIVPDSHRSSAQLAAPPPLAPPPQQTPALSSSSDQALLQQQSSPRLPSLSQTPRPQRSSYSPDSAAMAYQQQQQPYANPQYPPVARRTLSNATTSTSSTGGRKASYAGTTLTRTTSSRSGSSPTSYVALMRKQKATVWSDRAQHEDPRHVAQQRAAKMRAAREVSAANSAASATSTMTGGVRSKIRNHGVQKAQQYTPIAHPASGVPMRLSAREVEDDDEEDDDHLGVRGAHQRSGSGRSSVGSTGRVSSTYGPPGTVTGRSSEGSTPPLTRGSVASNAAPSTADQRARADTQSTFRSEDPAEPTPVPDDFRGADYFSAKASAQAEEAEEDFGKVGGLPRRVKNLSVEDKSADDLQRRGSVDERTSTMRGYGRLFVANPDLSD